MTTQYKWLPEQPTDEMMIAETESSYSRWSKYDIYRSMWKSAPEVNQEPAAIVRRYRDGTVVAEIRDKNMDEGTELYTHPQPDQTELIDQLTDELYKMEDERLRWMTMALTSQPKREPVGYIRQNLDDDGFDCTDFFKSQHIGAIPVYTHPQPRQEPLSNEVIVNLMREETHLDDSIGNAVALIMFAREIEKLHGIGVE